MLLVGQKLRFGISKHHCPFVHFLSANQWEICWIVPRPTSRPLHKRPLLVINLKNLHKMIRGQVSRVCSLILELTPASLAVLRNCCLWVTCIWERRPGNTCPKLSTMNLSGPRNRVDFNMNWVRVRVRIRLGAWGCNGIYLFFWLIWFSELLVNVKNKLNC